ncbi:MAG: hypothetical protein COB12_06300 [Flavobacterium sp.]|nr:MAG: hypothetical protein COB12_06300 [Flavobacterium sp.]
MRKLIIILILSIGFQSYSQKVTIEEIDAKTYTLFTAEQWKELIIYGEENVQDFYYYNVRMGVAYFKEREYHSAEKHLNKAISQESTEYAKEYLFWTYFNIGEFYLAEQVYDQLSLETKKNVDYKKTAIESVYLEIGLKSPNTNEVENTYYGNLVLKHRLGKNIKILHSVNMFLQNDGTQDFNSFQYHLSGTYFLETSAFNLGGVYNYSEFTFASDEEITGEFGNQLQVNYESSTIGDTYSVYVNYSRRFKRLRVNANFNYVTRNATNKNFTKLYLKEDGSLISEDFNNSNVTETVYIPSVGLMYTPEFTKDRISVGADFFFPITETETDIVFKPYLNVFILDQLWLNTSYLQVENYLFADYSSEILYNTPDLSVNRFVSTLSYAFSTKFITKLTYTYENYDFDNLVLNYDINSIFLGVQYKF